MRHGPKSENEILSLEIHKKHPIEKFMVIQELTKSETLTGTFDLGLTLLSSEFDMEGMKKNIPKTLDVFQGNNPRKKISWRGRPVPGERFGGV